MNYRPATAAVLAALIALSGCQREAKDGPLALSGKLFVFNYRVAVATYLVTLSRQAALPDVSFIEARFDNPQGGAALMIRDRIFPGSEKVVVQSPPVHCVKKDRPYRIELVVTDGAGKTLQRIETTLTADVDQSIMPGKPLVTGAGYERNPAVFAADGTADFSPEHCPAP